MHVKRDHLNSFLKHKGNLLFKKTKESEGKENEFKKEEIKKIREEMKEEERNLMNKKHKKTSKQIKFFKIRKSQRKIKKRETRVIRKFSKRKRTETWILPKRTKLCFCQTVRIKGKHFQKRVVNHEKRFFLEG